MIGGQRWRTPTQSKIVEGERSEGGEKKPEEEGQRLWREEANGKGGIRTPGDRKATLVFKTRAFNRSATFPVGLMFKDFYFQYIITISKILLLKLVLKVNINIFIESYMFFTIKFFFC